LERSLEVSVGEDVFADLKRVLHEQSL
jgi:hypothetical protein